jgi:hypothetical protein
MPDLGQAVLDRMLIADPVEDVVEGVFVVRHVGELDAVIGQHGVDGLRHGSDQVAQELGGDHLAARHLGQPADRMALQAAVQRGTCQVRDRRLQGIEAVIQRQQ